MVTNYLTYWTVLAIFEKDVILKKVQSRSQLGNKSYTKIFFGYSAGF
jgi:hypothetical protein